MALEYLASERTALLRHAQSEVARGEVLPSRERKPFRSAGVRQPGAVR